MKTMKAVDAADVADEVDAADVVDAVDAEDAVDAVDAEDAVHVATMTPLRRVRTIGSSFMVHRMCFKTIGGTQKQQQWQARMDQLRGLYQQHIQLLIVPVPRFNPTATLIRLLNLKR